MAEEPQEKHNENGDDGVQGKAKKPSAADNDKAKPTDIDGLLAAAAQSLTDLDAQLGEPEAEPEEEPEEAGTTAKADGENQTKHDALAANDKNERVDDTLDALEQDLSMLVAEVNDDSSQEDTTATNVEAVETDAVGEEEAPNADAKEESAAIAEEAAVIIDQLPDLPEAEQDAAEVTAIGPEESSTVDNAEQSDGADSGEGAAGDSSDNIDDVLAQLEQALSKEISDEADDADKDKQEDKPQTIAQSASGDGTEGQAEDEEVVSEEDQLVLDEIAGRLQDNSEADKADTEEVNEEDTEDCGVDYGDFPTAQRFLLQALQVVNRPFGFVSGGTRDIVGTVAVVTCLVTILATAILLLLQ